MCGIVAEIGDHSVSRAVFNSMVGALASRGPDAVGVEWLHGGCVALGHRRLSIVDLTDNAHQPMSNENQDIWLSFNGEIYNFEELRQKLLAFGHVFKSESDSEVIIHAYEQWGMRCLEYFRGMFAFVIWDSRKETLFAARDQLGVKPLYYWQSKSGVIVIASTPAAILKRPDFQATVDGLALQDFLVLGYIPYDRTIYNGVKKLPAGHHITVVDRRCKVQRYWQVCYAPRRIGEAAAVEAVEDQLSKSISRQLTGNVPIGSFLSGGVDSSAVTSIAAGCLPYTMNAYTIGFDDENYDERPYARILARDASVHHVEAILSTDVVTTYLNDIVAAYDEPFDLNGAMPAWFVSQLARRSGSKVVLAGDGGDELFAGYTHYDFLHKDARADSGSFWGRVLNRVKRPGNSYCPKSHIDRVGFLSGSDGSLRRVLGRSVVHSEDAGVWAYKMFSVPGIPVVASAQIVDMNVWLVDHVLFKMDRASMAHGVEVRVPILDLDLVELAFSMPHSLIFGAGGRKALLKRAVRGAVPSRLLGTRKKGFSSPLESWTGPAFRLWAANLLRSGVLAQSDLVNSEAAVQICESGLFRNLWLLVSLELWARHWIGGCAAPSPVFK
jgi:asparagine synthase (glutamine-hydrolysing)